MTEEQFNEQDIVHLLKTQTTCGRRVCDRTDLTHYCWSCGQNINGYNPGLCVIVPERTE